ncbi:DUF317 domain-containing protein [Streptomyces sp. NPDC048340]|uniref:DUF317 domain-containing protein n=1 Tax=Streptomyces sp. NPDC048340 TaxID=3365537 RepID=UPI00371AE53B
MPLHSHTPSEPGTPHTNWLWASPRHLTGDDGDLARNVGQALTAAGWSYWTTAHKSLFYSSPDQLRSAEWVLADPLTTGLGDLPIAWEISAREAPDRGIAAWTAYFTAGIPHEALTAFALALDVRSEPAWGFEEVYAVNQVLAAAGWAPDVDDPECTYWDASLASCWSWAPLPPGIEDQDPRPDLPGWMAWAQPELDRPYLWCAAFSHSVPHDLVAAFAEALVAPAPVPRRTLPAVSERCLTVSHTP